MPTKTVIEQLIIEIAGDSKKFKKTVKELKKQNKDLEGSYKKLNTVAVGAIAGIGTAAVLLGTVATKAFADFETGVTNVAKTTNLAGKDLEDFKDEIIKMSERIPVSTQKLLEISTAAGQLGIKGTANLSKFTEVIAKLGATTDLEGEQAALAIARILNLTNESIQSVDQLGSTLVDLGNNFAASESEILEVAKDVAKATVQFGLASNEILGISASMASLGIAAEAGGTVVGKAFQAIDAAIRKNTGPAFEKLIELTGLTGEQLNQTFAKDASKVFQLFIEGLGKAGAKGEDLTFALKNLDLKGIRVNKILPTLAERSDILADAMERAGIASKDASALNEEAATAFATTNNQLIIAQTKLNNSLIKMGEEIAPSAVEAITALSNAARDGAPIWRKLGEGVSIFATGLSNIVRFAAGAAFLIKKGANSVRELRKKNLKEAAAESDFLKKELKKRGVNSVKFLRLQKKARKKANREAAEEQKKHGKKISADEQEEIEARLAKQKETNELRIKEEEEANEEIFEDIQNLTDKVSQDLEVSNQKKLDTERLFRSNFAKLTDDARNKFTEDEKQALNDEVEQIKGQRKTVSDLKADEIIKEERQRTNAHNKFLRDEAEFGTLMAELKKFQGESEYTATKTAADSLAGLINSENDELKAIGKAASIVQIGISTAEGALKAFSSLAWIPYVGPALGGIAAAALVAYGGEQIAKVNAMKTGGIVPGTGSGDIVPTMLEPGELVVPRDDVAGVVAMMGARRMREGGVVGDKEKTDLNSTFDDIFGIPGIFKSILGMDGGDSDTNASGFGAEYFSGMAEKMADPLEFAANEMLRVLLSAIPGGEIIYEAIRATQRPKEELEKILGDNAITDLLDQFDLSDEVEGAIIGAGGTIIETGKGLVGGATGLIDDFRDALPTFKKGGIVPGSGSGDKVHALLEPGEVVIPNGFASSIGGMRSSNMRRPSISGSTGRAGAGGGGVERVIVGFDIGIQDDLVDFITVKQREKDILGT